MRIHSITTVLAIPLVLIALYVYFYLDHYDPNFLYYLLFPILLLAALFMSRAHIDYWWHTKYPMPLDHEIIAWLERYDTFYNALNPTAQKKFQYRLGLYLEAREFKLIGKEQMDVPEDMKLPFAATAIRITFNHEDFLLGDFDRVFLYRHPFPSPRYQFLHTYEIDTEDGIMIFSMEQAVHGFIQPMKYYNICLHGYAEAFVHQYKTYSYPDVNQSDMDAIGSIIGSTYDEILTSMGFSVGDPLIVMITMYFSHHDMMRSRLPHIVRSLDNIFKPDLFIE